METEKRKTSPDKEENSSSSTTDRKHDLEGGEKRLPQDHVVMGSKRGKGAGGVGGCLRGKEEQ